MSMNNYIESDRGLELSGSLLLREYQSIAQEYGIDLSLPIKDYAYLCKAAAKIDLPTQIDFLGKKRNVSPLNNRGSLPSSLRNERNLQLRYAAIFFHELIRPLLATGRDAYKPNDEDIINFCNVLASNQLTIVIYYALSKTQSPIRTGSPDTIIDFAELEMLKYYGLIVGVGQNLGFYPRIIIVDETSEIPRDYILGFNEKDQQINGELVRSYLAGILPQGGIQIKSLSQSVRDPLGPDFNSLYQPLFEKNCNRIEELLTQRNWAPETIRMRIFLECATPAAWEEYHIEEILPQLKDPTSFLQIPHNLLTYLVATTAHFSTIMSLREEARKRVLQEERLDEFPEYSSERIYGGVTRSSNRWSFLPHPVKYLGRTINPMHSLALYSSNEREFLGYIPYSEAYQNGHNIIYYNYYNNRKPLFVLL